MSNDQHQFVLELIPAYALNSLDSQDREMVAGQLAGCASCRAELAAYEAVVDLLPLAATEVEPSPVLKLRLGERIRAEQAGKSGEESLPSGGYARQSPLKRIVDSVGGLFQRPAWQASMVLLLVVLAVANLMLWQRVQRAEERIEPWQQVLLSGTEAAPGAQGLIFISADGEYGTLIVNHLPQLSGLQQYQLWLIKDGERTSGGVFSVSEDGYRSLEIIAPQPLSSFDGFGITVEPTGGSNGPTGEKVLGGSL